jgi:RNA polymerase sigma-70 factor (ECF subfamily)
MMDESDRAAVDRDTRAALAKGDPDGAATIFLRAYGPEIFGFLVALHRDEAAAGDAFSAFAEGVWRGLPGFSWSSSLRTWAYAIARNVSVTARRREGRKQRREANVGASVLDEVEQVVRSATQTFLRTERRTRLEQLRDALPENDRALLVLRVDRKLSWNDLARVLADAPLADDAAVVREAARLRKRFQLVKERLRASAGREPDRD